MKVISIMQPWASLIAIGAKQFETRSWKTNYRGPIAIHASKKEPIVNLRQLPATVQKLMFDRFYAKYGTNSGAIKNMPTGVILAVANLTECYQIHRPFEGYLSLTSIDSIGCLINECSPECEFGDYTPGRFAWELEDVKQIEPIPAKGQLNLWNYDL